MSNPTEAIDLAKLQQLLQLAGKYGPVLYALVQDLVNLLKDKPPMKAARHDGDCCPVLACCIETAKKHQIEALCHILHLEHECCHHEC